MPKDPSVVDAESKQTSAAIEKIELQMANLTTIVTNLVTNIEKLSTIPPPIPFIKAEVHSDDDGIDENGSVVSHASDVQFITKMLHPSFQNKDAITKQDQDRLKQVQDKFLQKIPMLQYSGVNEKTHNYAKWSKALLKYFAVLSPVLAETTKTFLSTIDIDEFVQSDNPNSIVSPKISEHSYPDLMKLLAYSAITNSLSTEF